jgi:hypothetical protein
MQQGGGGPFIGALRVRATRPCAWERQGGDGSARLVARNRASTHARAQSAARQQLQQVRVEATHAQACPIADGCGEVNKTLESRRDSRRNEACQQAKPRRLRALDGSSRQWPRRCPLHRGSKASGGTLHEHLLIERVAPTSGRRSGGKAECRWTASTQRHAARAVTRWLQDAGAKVAALWRGGIDAWTAQWWEFHR